MAGPVPISKLAQELGISPRKWLGLPKPSPKPTGGIRQKRLDDYIDNLRQVRGPAGYIKEISHDKRTIKSVQRLTREISSTAKPRHIARQLGMSYQRWTAIKKKIENGEAYGPELRENLKQLRTEVIPEHEEKLSPNGSKYDYFQNENTLDKIKIRWWKKVTPRGYDTLDQAAEWWERIGGGADYFVIAGSISKRTGRRVFNVYDIRTAGELKNKGKLKNIIRAREIIQEEYGK